MKKIPIILLLIIFSGCGVEHQFSSAFLAMGNIPVEITVFSRQNVPDELFEEIKDTVRVLDSLFNKYDEQSPLYRFNVLNEPLPSNIHTDSLIYYSLKAMDITKGHFDIGVETVLTYYRRSEKRGRIDDDSIAYFASILESCSLIREGNYYIKKNEQYMIDMGGIAKGYFGEIIKRILKQNGIEKAIINLAGDIVLFNDADSKEYCVGVRDASGEGLFTTVNIANDAVMTSGDYFRYYSIDDEQYCHIINPITGRPNEQYHSVTVMYENGAMTDAFATGFMLMDSIEIGHICDSLDISIIYQ